MTGPPSRISWTAARLIVAGRIAPFPFIALVILQGLLQPGYSHVVQPISALAALPLGWLQNINFYVAGTLLIDYAIGLHFSISPALPVRPTSTKSPPRSATHSGAGGWQPISWC
jgi:hypothetical protein